MYDIDVRKISTKKVERSSKKYTKEGKTEKASYFEKLYYYEVQQPMSHVGAHRN